ncbi:PIN domain-containing protein [Halorussus litoreus]|uniref:PIN domain-containing protein n=1 Tax=Halorussus litoreus TaxID=1710536 RepID=UPI000E21CA7B|nr:PIN domain-containing protein [Halorussus litoreus]
MTLYDSSVLIDYLDGVDDAVNYVETHLDERAVAPPLVAFEVYQGEIFKSGQANFDAVEGALEWVSIVDDISGVPRAAAELQNELASNGEPLAARDAFIAGAAKRIGEPLAIADSDFDVDGITDHVTVDFL